MTIWWGARPRPGTDEQVRLVEGPGGVQRVLLSRRARYVGEVGDQQGRPLKLYEVQSQYLDGVFEEYLGTWRASHPVWCSRYVVEWVPVAELLDQEMTRVDAQERLAAAVRAHDEILGVIPDRPLKETLEAFWRSRDILDSWQRRVDQISSPSPQLINTAA